MSKERNPEYQFRGFFVHADLEKMMADGTINPAEMVLACMIDSYVKCGGEGCWASNEHLGSRIHRSVATIERMVSKLRGLGIIRQVGWKITEHGRFRLLETKWSRIGGPLKNGGRGIPENNGTPPPENKGENKKVDSRREKKGVPAAPRRPASPPKAVSSEESLPHRDMAVELRKILRSKNPPIPVRTYHLSTGEEEFRKLEKSLKGDRSRILRLLQWYKSNINSIAKPVILSAKQFHEQFTWLEDLMRKDIDTEDEEYTPAVYDEWPDDYYDEDNS